MIITISEFLIKGTTRSELDTEVKFNIATARVDGAEMVRFAVPRAPEGGDDDRSIVVLTKLLKGITRNGDIQFFAFSSDIEASTLEGVFLLNKYNDFILPDSSEYTYIYVKM